MGNLDSELQDSNKDNIINNKYYQYNNNNDQQIWQTAVSKCLNKTARWHLFYQRNSRIFTHFLLIFNSISVYLVSLQVHNMLKRALLQLILNKVTSKQAFIA